MLSHSANNPNAGASRIYHLLQDGLSERGHDVRTLHLEDMGMPQHALGKLLAQRLVMPGVVSRRAGRERPEQFDVVMASSGMAHPLFRDLRRRPSDAPFLVHHLHGLAVYDYLANTTQHDLELAPASLPYRFVTGPRQVHWDDRGAQRADLIVTQNLRDDSYVRTRYPDRDTTIVPPALHPRVGELARQRPERTRRSRHDVLWFATWESRKGAHLVPPAFRRLRTTHPEARLVVGGTGMAPDAVRSRFAREDRSSVEVLGHVDVAEQAEYFERCGIILFPSLSEGFGLALIEAMAFGCVPVTTATGFAADHVVDHRHGLVVPPTHGHIAQALDELMTNPGLLNECSGRARELALEFTHERMCATYEQIFVAGSTRRSARS